jgi:hypothetical protein
MYSFFNSKNKSGLTFALDNESDSDEEIVGSILRQVENPPKLASFLNESKFKVSVQSLYKDLSLLQSDKVKLEMDLK